MKRFITGLIVCVSLACISAVASAQLPLVPYPQSVKMGEGELALPSDARIVATESALAPLATVLGDEIVRAGGPHLQVAASAPKAGDIVLKLDDSLKDEAYHLDVQDRATVSGGNYDAVAMGTVTLLQAMTFENVTASVPHMTVQDQPAYGYRGVMIDVARQRHSLGTLRQVVELCRLYKVRYLQLHLTDDGAFTFPSTLFPQLNSKNGSIPAYKLDELKAFVKFADEHGVTIVPELEAPGHCGMMQRTMPDTFGMIGPDGKPVKIECFNFINPKAYPAMDKLVGEMCDVFKSSPYFHIGSDEAWLGTIGKRPEIAQYVKDNGMASDHELYTQYIVKMNDIVKAHNKKTIVWEGFGGTGSEHFKIPTDVTVMEFEVRYNLPQNLVKNGYNVINASWTPLYVVNGRHQTPENILSWNIFRFGQFPSAGWDKVHWTEIKPTPQVVGAQMCTWEQPELVEIPSLRARVPAVEQRIWDPQAPADYAEFSKRFAHDDALLDKLLYGFALNVAPGPTPTSDNAYLFTKSATVTASTFAPDLKVRYTINGEEPTADSPVLDAPLQITEKNCVNHDNRNAMKSMRCTLTAQAFREQTPAGASRVLFLDNYDYLDRMPQTVTLKIYENPTGDTKRPDFSKITLVRQTTQSHILPGMVRDLPAQGAVLVYEGKINVPADAQYEFALHSGDAGSQLYINDKLVCDQSGPGNKDETKGSIKLPAGPATFKVECYMAGKGTTFSLSMTDPSTNKKLDWNKLLIPLDKQGPL